MIKIVIVGECNVGKSNLLLRFMHNTFTDHTRATVATEFHTMDVTYNEKPVRVQLWDTAGQERYRSLIPSFFTRCDGAILVFDMTNRESFLRLEEWIYMLREKASENTKLLIVGNKSDLVAHRVVSHEEAATFAQKLNVFYWETSAKDNSSGNVNAAFNEIIEVCSEEKWVTMHRDDALLSSRISKRGSIGEIQMRRAPQEKKCCS